MFNDLLHLARKSVRSPTPRGTAPTVSARPRVEPLEDRCLLTGGLTLYDVPVPTRPDGPAYFAEVEPAPDGSAWFSNYSYYSNKVGRITPDGTIAEYAIAATLGLDFVGAASLAVAADSSVWATVNGNKLVHITTDGTITTFPLADNQSVSRMQAGPDGNFWFLDWVSKRFGRFMPGGAVTEFDLPSATDVPDYWTVGPDGSMWFTVPAAHKIGMLTAAGQYSFLTLPDSVFPRGLTIGGDGNIWFTANNDLFVSRYTSGYEGVNPNFVGRLTQAGALTLYEETTFRELGPDIFTGSDGNVYYPLRENTGFARRTMDGQETQFDRSSVSEAFHFRAPVVDVYHSGVTVWSIVESRASNPADQGPDRIGKLTFENSPPVNTFISSEIFSLAGQNVYGLVAKFVTTTLDRNNTAVNYDAMIDWGDGTTSAGWVASLPSSIELGVSGIHTYSEAGIHHITVTLTPGYSGLDFPPGYTYFNDACATSTVARAEAMATAVVGR